jgi:peptidoglycan/LPS O-acetylase OafA/YrhL
MVDHDCVAETPILAQGKMDGLTGLRAIAALWVIAFHYSVGPFAALHLRQAIPLFRFGYLGVDLFFMLSGFVIWHAHAADFVRPTARGFRRFILLRVARLYPVYLFTLLLFLGILLIAPHFGDPRLDPKNYTAGQFVVDLGMVQTWGLAGHLEWNYPSWSVSAEWFCYFMFPLAALSLSHFGRWRSVLGVGALVVALAGIYLCVFNETMNVALGIAALARALIEFLCGCLLRRVADFVPVDRVKWSVPLVVIVAMIAISAHVHSGWTGFLPILLFPVLIMAASTRETLVGRIMSWRPFVVVGGASYSLYLMQAPVQKAMRFLGTYISLHHPTETLLAMAGYGVALMIGTILVYRFVELPSRRALRRQMAA